jgi:hypothetical protein
MVFLVIGLIFADQSMLFSGSPVPTRWIIAAATIGLIACAGWTKWRRLDRPAQTAVAAGHRQHVGPSLRALTIVVLIAITVAAIAMRQPRGLIFHDRTNDVFFGQVAAGSGLLLTAGDLHLIQLKTRRPVLLDGGGLDGLLYSLEGGPAMERIMREVYGIDLLNPPAEARGSGRIPPLATQQVWQRYTLEQWQEIKRKFGVAQVLTYPDWMLNLPVAAHNRRFVLYQIP